MLSPTPSLLGAATPNAPILPVPSDIVMTTAIWLRGLFPFYATSSEILLNFSSPLLLYAVIALNSLFFSVLFACMFFLKIWKFMSKFFIAFLILRKCLLGVCDLIILYISYILILKKVSLPDNIVLVMVMKMCCRSGLRPSPLLWFKKRFFGVCGGR